jgi:hypothetical protein
MFRSKTGIRRIFIHPLRRGSPSIGFRGVFLDIFRTAAAVTKLERGLARFFLPVCGKITTHQWGALRSRMQACPTGRGQSNKESALARPLDIPNHGVQDVFCSVSVTEFFNGRNVSYK